MKVQSDPTATSETWGRDRGERGPECPHVTVTPLRGAIRNNLIDLEEAYGTVLVDVGGHDSQESLRRHGRKPSRSRADRFSPDPR
ncbi:hypothetical protein GCM10027449_15920 [Sinomonas notoginsengisoli]